MACAATPDARPLRHDEGLLAQDELLGARRVGPGRATGTALTAQPRGLRGHLFLGGEHDGPRGTLPPPPFTYASTRRLPPHLTQTNTSKSNVLLSNSAQSTRGDFSFIGSLLAAAWGSTLASSAPAWGSSFSLRPLVSNPLTPSPGTKWRIISTHSADTTRRVPIITPSPPTVRLMPSRAGADGGREGSENFNAESRVIASMDSLRTRIFWSFSAPARMASRVAANASSASIQRSCRTPWST
ncbi:hypothetical protein F0U60_15145 [Archangium minus]|uniref:Uncharacterized protein n=1 Tax=Archangium minus TaxID=83450 RepID=A0ABY9WNI7_9BACT|nr:hypothetical protein F0U60_15145 [Archangium minus]